MEINDLIRLAAKADSEGNFRVADRITEKIENMSRTVLAFDLGKSFKFFGTAFMNLLSGSGAKRVTDLTAPVPTGFKRWSYGKTLLDIPEDKYDEVINGFNIANSARKARRGQPKINQEGSNNAVIGGDDLVDGAGGAKPGNIQQQTNSPVFNIGGGVPVPGAQGERGLRGFRGYKGLKGDPGPQGPAGKWWPGLVAGLLSGAIGAGGVAAWLSSRGADDVVIRDIENHLGRLPQFQMMTRRTDSGDLTGAKAIRAQNFVDSNSTNPRLKNQRDWYNLALQQSGGDENFANNVISLVKATPQMPSSIGGGPNI